MPDDPADEVLLEFGRLVWAAIELEGIVYTMCRSIQPRHGPYDDHPIGARIGEARSDLRERPKDSLRRGADRWLTAAEGALNARNSIVHSVLVIWASYRPGCSRR